jgi:hypothetical protein
VRFEPGGVQASGRLDQFGHAGDDGDPGNATLIDGREAYGVFHKRVSGFVAVGMGLLCRPVGVG